MKLTDKQKNYLRAFIADLLIQYDSYSINNDGFIDAVLSEIDVI